MKKLIPSVVFVLVANMALAQKEITSPVSTPTVGSAQVKSHSNTNNNRESGGGTKVGNLIPGTGKSGTKKKFDLGKLFKKK